MAHNTPVWISKLRPFLESHFLAHPPSSWPLLEEDVPSLSLFFLFSALLPVVLEGRGQRNQEFDEPQSEKKKELKESGDTLLTPSPPDVLYNERFNECPACF